VCVQGQLSAKRGSRKERVGVKSRCSVESKPWLCARRAFVPGLAMPVSNEIGVVGRQTQACPSSLSLRSRETEGHAGRLVCVLRAGALSNRAVALRVESLCV
jgi:hypothetical protein